MEAKLIRSLVVLGVPGVALGVFYLLLRKFDFEFEAVGPIWSAIVAIVFLVIVGGVTLYALRIRAPERTRMPTPTPAELTPLVAQTDELPDGLHVEIHRLPATGQFLV